MKRLLLYIGVLLMVLCASCSTTSGLMEDEVLYRGINKMQIDHPDKSEHGLKILDEVKAVLECPPNGALLGSSSMTTPFPIGLWIYNGFSNSTDGLGKWIKTNFGHAPVLISTVNPTLRAKMAAVSLQNYGYFRSTVTSEVVPDPKNPKKAKVNYTVDMKQPYVLDSITYHHFDAFTQSLIDSTMSQSLIRKGVTFSAHKLDEERNRIARLLQNNGYYYYKPNYMTYKADTLQVPWKVQLRMEPVATSDIPLNARHGWKVGDLRVNLRKNANSRRLRDSLQTRRMKVFFRGKKSPVRPRVLVHNLYFRADEPYSIDKQQLSEQALGELGIFSQVNLEYTPHDTTAICDVLDVTLDAVMDKPLSAELSADVRTKSNGQVGPKLDFGVVKKNLFRGGETFRFDLNGSYEWQTQRRAGESSSKINSYELGASVSLEFPRILFPKLADLRSHHARSTTVRLAADKLHRAGFFDLMSFTGELTYTWQNTPSQKFAYSPLRMTFSKLNSVTERFDSIMSANKSLFLSMTDQFIPAMVFSYTYDNSWRNPTNRTWWQSTITESGNLLSVAKAIGGQKFNEENKTLFHNPYAQFVKLTTEYRHTFALSEKSSLATRVMTGLIYTYGNSSVAPYNEQFYIGGANSIRAYTVRAVGPGGYHSGNSSFLDQTGDFKFEANAEYRFNLVGSFNGALFLDAGNVWLTRKDPDRPGAELQLRHVLDQLALGTGIGLRYDMDFLVLRLDLGVAIHNPYKTTKSGYYNIPRFKDSMSLHFAIGYPF